MAMEIFRVQRAKLRKVKKQFQRENHPFNHYRISTIDESLADLEAWRGCVRAELVKVGGQVYQALCDAEGLLSFHDKCQVLGRDHRGVARQIERENIPKDATFSDMVNIYDLEYSGKSDLLPIYSPAIPLFTACYVYFTHEMIHNRELTDKAGEMFKEMFPGMSWSELRVDHRGKEYMQRLPPGLRLA